MKVVAVAVAALTLTACGAINKPTTSAAAPTQAGTYYCWKDKLATNGDNLSCNWERERHVACETTYPVTISKSRVSAGPTDAGRCSNGQWLVMVTMR